MKLQPYPDVEKKSVGSPELAPRKSSAVVAVSLILLYLLSCSKNKSSQENLAENGGWGRDSPVPAQSTENPAAQGAQKWDQSKTYYVSTLSDLPSCDESRKGYLYYIADLRKFQSCDGKSWQGVEISSNSSSGPLDQSSEKFYSTLVSSNFLYENGLGITRNVIRYTADSSGTNVIKTCTVDSWNDTQGVPNGYRTVSRTYGDRLCGDSTVTSIACNSGHYLRGSTCTAICMASNLTACATREICTAPSVGMSWVGGRCLGFCGASNLAACDTEEKCTGGDGSGPGAWVGNSCAASCPQGKVKTSRGCETPTVCGPTQNAHDNSCVNIAFSQITGNICGTYSVPIRITSGSHFVTCNTQFNDAVVIEDGAAIEVDDLWSVAFNKTLYAVGTAGQGIVFKASSGNPRGRWASLSVSNLHDYGAQTPFSYQGTYNFGTKLSGVKIQDVARNSDGGNVALSGHLSYITILNSNTAINLGSTTFPIYVESSAISGDLISLNSGPGNVSILKNVLTVFFDDVEIEQQP